MINDLKDFEKFLKICRKQGVTEVSFGGATVKLGELPSKENEASDVEEIPTDALTQDELIYYAVNGVQQ